MASRLARGLSDSPLATLLQNVESNEVFVALPEKLIERLEKADFHFYRWPLIQVPEGAAVRFVTSYMTTEADVEDFLREMRKLA
jgi:threonine aldolase